MKPVPVWEVRDSVGEIDRNTLYDMKKTVILAIQEAVAEEIDEFQGNTFDYVNQQLVENAEGEALDLLAALYDVFREESENDEDLKGRIKIVFLRQSLSVSRQDIRTALETIIGTSEFTILNRSNNNIWLTTPIGCFTSKNYQPLAELFPVNHNLKISNFERTYAGGQQNPASRPFGSFFVDGDETETGTATAFVYDRERSLYGN